MTATKTKHTPKLAMYFPEFQTSDDEPQVPSLFSEKSIRSTENLIAEAHKDMGGLLGFIVQKYKTYQLGKQLDSLKEAVDATLEEKKKQLAIQFEEETKRLQIRVEANKTKHKADSERLNAEIDTKAKEFGYKFEEAVKTDGLFTDLIKGQLEVISEYREYTEKIPNEFRNCREYITYCDVQKKAIDQINNYLAEIV